MKCIDEEIPFEIPLSWCWVRLVSIGNTETGTTPSKTHPEYFGDYMPFIGPGNIQNNRIMSYTQGISEVGVDYCRPVPKNTILQVCIGGSIGKAAITTEQSAFNQQINSIETYKCVDYKYVYYTLLTDYFKKAMLERSTGTATPIINRSNWEGIILPIPPQYEQQRIVSRIEELMHVANKYEKSQEALDRLNTEIYDKLKKSVLQEAIQGKLVSQDPNDEPASVLLERIEKEKAKLFKNGKLKKKDLIDSFIFKGEDNKYYEQIGKEATCVDDEIPFDIPNTWSWIRLGHIFQHNTGKALNGSNKRGTPYEYITTSNLYWNQFVLEKLRQMPFTDDELDKCTVKKGDLLVCEGGDIGRSAIWNYDNDIRIQNHIHRLRAYVPVCTMFFYYTLYLYKRIGLIGGKGIGIQGLSSNALHNLLLPLPPVKEQQRISESIANLFSKLS